MWTFDPAEYGPKVAELLAEARLPELGPGQPNKKVLELLGALTPDDVVPSASHPDFVACCMSGLWLWHDFLHDSHEISQDIATPSGSYWHAIMHRREPDYPNSKYWYRRVGDHAIFPRLLGKACQLASLLPVQVDVPLLVNKSTWDPYAFADLCASVRRCPSETEMFCREVAQYEWQLLFDDCFQNAQ